MANDTFKGSSGDKSLLQRAVRPRLNLRDVSDNRKLYDGVGAELNAARRRDGLDISAVASELRILNRYIEAIEEGRFADLPGDVYILGFLRSYAQLLNLNPEVVLEQYKIETAAPRPETVLDFPSPRDRGRLPSVKLLVAVGLFLTILYAGWFSTTKEQRLTSATVSPLPERFSSEKEEQTTPVVQSSFEVGPGVNRKLAPSNSISIKQTATVDPIVPPSSEVLSADKVTASEAAVIQRSNADSSGVIENTKEKHESANVVEKRDGEEREEARLQSETQESELDGDPPVQEKLVSLNSGRSAPGEPSDEEGSNQDSGEGLGSGGAEAAVAGSLNAVGAEDLSESPGDSGIADQSVAIASDENRVVIFAKADSWVQIENESGGVVMSGLLRAGENYSVPDRKDMLLMTGNAGGLVIFVDGAPISELGGNGTIVRNISLDPELLNMGD